MLTPLQQTICLGLGFQMNSARRCQGSAVGSEKNEHMHGWQDLLRFCHKPYKHHRCTSNRVVNLARPWKSDQLAGKPSFRTPAALLCKVFFENAYDLSGYEYLRSRRPVEASGPSPLDNLVRPQFAKILNFQSTPPVAMTQRICTSGITAPTPLLFGVPLLSPFCPSAAGTSLTFPGAHLIQEMK